ncbi:MAG TPA: DUF4396 domain-containing protein [Candidatus Saccharimonadales bacterium]
MTIDQKTRQAIDHTIHCLIGCGIGEILGMIIASQLGWHRYGRISLAIILAFCFGYALTYRNVRKKVETSKEAIKITLATDTVSITTMEIVDNTIELIIPNALIVSMTSFRFWWGLALSLTIAFIITVPINRYMISRNGHAHMH